MKNYSNPATTPLDRQLFTIGYYSSLFGIALVLIWIGIFKFTPTEAAAIRPLVNSHPLMSWLYSVLSVQAVSNLIGVIELLTAFCILLSPFQRIFRYAAAVGILATFISTLSFLFTTGSWKMVDGVPVTDFFILKDVVCLGFGLMIVSFPAVNIHR